MTADIPARAEAKAREAKERYERFAGIGRFDMGGTGIDAVPLLADVVIAAARLRAAEVAKDEAVARVRAEVGRAGLAEAMGRGFSLIMDARDAAAALDAALATLARTKDNGGGDV